MTYKRFQYLVARSHRDNAKFFALMEAEDAPYQWAIDRNNFAAIKDAADALMQVVYAEDRSAGDSQARRKRSSITRPRTASRCSSELPDLWDEVFKFPNNGSNYAPDKSRPTQKTNVDGPAPRIEAGSERAQALQDGHQAPAANPAGACERAAGVAVAARFPAGVLGPHRRPAAPSHRFRGPSGSAGPKFTASMRRPPSFCTARRAQDLAFLGYMRNTRPVIQPDKPSRSLDSMAT
jgi:hypothetical protein